MSHDELMTMHELVVTLDCARDDLRDGFLTEEEFLSLLSDMFDGDVTFARQGTRRSNPKLRMFLVDPDGRDPGAP